MDFWQAGFWASGFWSDGFWGEATPEVAPILLGRQPRKDIRKENDEALLLMLGMM